MQPVPCHEIQSFYTWSPLLGINLDLLFLVLNIAFYFGLLVALELGYVSVLRSYLDLRKRVKNGVSDSAYIRLTELDPVSTQMLYV